jgi:hypothetical protein
VRYWDEHHRTAKWVCWGCERLHWQRDSHGTPPHPLDITVEGEFQYGPLRSDGFGDFLPTIPPPRLTCPRNWSPGCTRAARGRLPCCETVT